MQSGQYSASPSQVNWFVPADLTPNGGQFIRRVLPPIQRPDLVQKTNPPLAALVPGLRRSFVSRAPSTPAVPRHSSLWQTPDRPSNRRTGACPHSPHPRTSPVTGPHDWRAIHTPRIGRGPPTYVRGYRPVGPSRLRPHPRLTVYIGGWIAFLPFRQQTHFPQCVLAPEEEDCGIDQEFHQCRGDHPADHWGSDALHDIRTGTVAPKDWQ